MSYDRLARWYGGLEHLVFGGVLQEARVELLQVWEGPDPERVLVLGEGDGRFLARALERWPQTTFVSIEQSAGMRERARRRFGHQGARVIEVGTDVREALSLLEERAFDVVVTHFFLDGFCEDSLETLVTLMDRVVRAEAVWFVSEFRERGWWTRAAVKVMYVFFRSVTGMEAGKLPHHQRWLAARGWSRRELRSWLGGFVVAEAWRRQGHADRDS